MTAGSASVEFTHWVQKALTSLYDPSVLGSSPLVELLLARRGSEPAPALQRILLESIEALRPSQRAPVGSRAWRVYQILRARYTEQLPQPRVAADLGLSIRQLQREEAVARSVLADHLWTLHNLDSRKQAPISPAGATVAAGASAEPGTLARAQELAAIADSTPLRMTDVGSIVQSALKTIAPLAQSAHVALDYAPQANLPRIPLQGAMLRQALLDILNVAIVHAQGEQVHVQAGVAGGNLGIYIYGEVRATARAEQPLLQVAEDLELARQMISFCHGVLEVSLPDAPVPPPPTTQVFRASITFPLAEQIPVLIVDDNSDTLKLLQRYLEGSRYRFVGVKDAQRALAAAVKGQPQVVVLDVMMPEQDGWTLLSELREHPKTRDIPVIVCTIMSQKELALAVGAAEFMRKPVSQIDLLAALDRQIDQTSRVSRSET